VWQELDYRVDVCRVTGRPHWTSVNVRRNLESFSFMLYLYLWNKFITVVTAMFSFCIIHSELPSIKWNFYLSSKPSMYSFFLLHEFCADILLRIFLLILVSSRSSSFVRGWWEDSLTPSFSRSRFSSPAKEYFKHQLLYTTHKNALILLSKIYFLVPNAFLELHLYFKLTKFTLE
jgi:hypothetical protein